MPRLPVDGNKVVEHRVTLGTYERQQLDTLVTGVTVKNVGDPLVALLSDVSAIAVLAGILEALGVIDITGLAKKLGGQAGGWIDAVLAGTFQSLDAAMADYERRAWDWYNSVGDGILPGGDPWTPFSGGGVPQEYQLPLTGRAWAMTQIYQQQAVTMPAYRGYGGP